MLVLEIYFSLQNNYHNIFRRNIFQGLFSFNATTTKALLPRKIFVMSYD